MQGEMGWLEKISADFEVREAKKMTFRQSILSLLMQWREFEGQLNSSKKDLHHSFEELQSREKNLQSEQQLLEVALDWIQQRFKELEDREREFLLFQEKKDKIYELKEKEIVRIRENYAKEVEEKFSEQEKDIELFRDSIEKKARELEYNEGKIKEREKKVEQKDKELTERGREVELKEKELQFLIENNEFKEKQIDFIRNLIENRIKELDMMNKKLEMKFEYMKEKGLETKLLEKECQDLESRKDEIQDRIKGFQVKEKELEESFKDLNSKVKESQLEKEILEHEFKVLESRKKELEDMIKKEEFELKEKQQKAVYHAGIKKEPLETVIDLRSPVVTITNGKDLQIALNEQSKDNLLMNEVVFRTLQSSKDPAKLVLEAMEGFYPPRLMKGNREFPGFVVRRSCTILLQHLIRMSPWIGFSVRKEALKIAMEWKTKITPGSSSEALGFLCLVSCYGLESAFAVEDIRRFTETVGQHGQIPEWNLFRGLGLMDEFPFPQGNMEFELERCKRRRAYY